MSNNELYRDACLVLIELGAHLAKVGVSMSHLAHCDSEVRNRMLPGIYRMADGILTVLDNHDATEFPDWIGETLQKLREVTNAPFTDSPKG